MGETSLWTIYHETLTFRQWLFKTPKLLWVRQPLGDKKLQIIVTGSLGQIGSPVAKRLLATGHTVTVVTHSHERQAEIEALGARAVVGSVEDQAFLAKAFVGAEAVFALLPPSYTVTDLPTHARRIGVNFAHAIDLAGVARVAYLSSWGADLDHGTGFIVGTHFMEQALGGVSAAVTHLRATSLYGNLFNVIPQIKHAGTVTSNYGGDNRLVLVHTDDIADAVVDELRSPAVQRKIRYVASDTTTIRELARTLGEAIGRPELAWTVVSDDDLRTRLLAQGLSAYAADLRVELGVAHRTGLLMEDFERHQPIPLGRVKIGDFAREFAQAFERS